MVSTETVALQSPRKSRTRWAVEVGVKGVLWLWCLFVLLLFGPFAGQRKRGPRAGVLL